MMDIQQSRFSKFDEQGSHFGGHEIKYTENKYISKGNKISIDN